MQEKPVEKLIGGSIHLDTLVIKQVGVQETYPIHTHDFYEFFLVTRGRALHVVNGARHLIERGALVLIRPRDVHFYDHYNDSSFEFYNMGLSGKTFQKANRYFDGALDEIDRDEFPKHVILDDDQTDRLESLLVQLKRQTPQEFSLPLYNLIVASVGYAVLTGVEKEPQGTMPDWLFRLIEEMDRKENFVPGLDRMLELANYSQEHINRMFQQFLKTTPTHFINAKRLAYARSLLQEGGISISEVCEKSGFHNVSHFYDLYKARFGQTPARDGRQCKAKRE